MASNRLGSHDSRKCIVALGLPRCLTITRVCMVGASMSECWHYNFSDIYRCGKQQSEVGVLAIGLLGVMCRHNFKPGNKNKCMYNATLAVLGL